MYALKVFLRFVFVGILLCFGIATITRAQEAEPNAPAAQTQARPEATSNAANAANSANDPARVQAEAQTQSALERERQQAEQDATKNLDREAVAALMETQNAIKAIAGGQTDEALAAIERATGKIEILVGRNPANALIPVAAEVKIINTAPADLAMIQQLAGAVKDAVKRRDFPAARVVLGRLMSEIRVRTYNLPMASYPVALKDAARLLTAQKPQEASAVLTTALNTLVAIERVSPIPVAVAQTAIEAAQKVSEQDKESAKQLLAVAKSELDRARELGYAGDDQEYRSLNDAIASLDRQLNGNESTASAFTRLREKIASFFKRQSDSERSSETGGSVAAADRTRR
jgi:hypothetical protein